MEEFTRKFNVAQEKDAEIRHILTTVYAALEDKGYTFLSSEIEKVPSTYVTLTSEDDIKHMNLLLENLEENEDIVNVWHNWDQE